MCLKPSVVFIYLNALYVINEIVKNFNSTLSGGSLGLWVDEERSKLRVDMWTAGHMNIDILNAYCGPYWFVSFIRSCMDHTWLRVVRLLNKNCIFITIGCLSIFWLYSQNKLVSSGNINIFDTQNTIIIDWKAFKFKNFIANHIMKKLVFWIIFLMRPQLMWDYSLNLSILMREGKEIN